MPLKLNVGLSRKVGLPGYGSLGASCSLEGELPSMMLTGDSLRRADGRGQSKPESTMDRAARCSWGRPSH